jgi:hypothetical protein
LTDHTIGNDLLVTPPGLASPRRACDNLVSVFSLVS